MFYHTYSFPVYLGPESFVGSRVLCINTAFSQAHAWPTEIQVPEDKTVCTARRGYAESQAL